MQYDSAPLTVAGMQKNGIGLRQQNFEAPEGATKDRTRYSVCTTYAHEIYYQTFGWKLGGGVPGCFTANLEKNLPAGLIVFRQDNLACPDGKTAAAAQARALLEPGDLLVDFVPEHWAHAMFYAGDTDGDGRDEVLHSSGRKYDMLTGLDAVEIGGSIYKDDAESLLFTPGNGSLHELTHVKRYFIVRPLRLAAKDWPLTPSSETRLRYPRLRIDRTVSGGVYASVPTGGTLVYTIEISNHSTDGYKDASGYGMRAGGDGIGCRFGDLRRCGGGRTDRLARRRARRRREETLLRRESDGGARRNDRFGRRERGEDTLQHAQDLRGRKGDRLLQSAD